MPHRGDAGTSLAEARERLRAVVAPHGRTERRPLAAADGRVLAAPVDARADVPHYARAAMDGFAVRAADVAASAPASPVTLDLAEGAVGPGTAVSVNTGSELPAGADAVVRLERTERDGDRLRVLETVPAGEDVAPAGEDVAAGQRLYDAGHRLRPSDLGLLKASGVGPVSVVERPTVAVLPTGEELVDAAPAAGETVETNGLLVERSVARWGGEPRARGPVTDEPAAIERALVAAAADADLVVTTGGSSVGERDHVPAVVEAAGDLLVHHVAVKPGHPVGLGVVDETPVVVLPGYPVSCIVNAVQLVRPAVAWLAGTEPRPPPTTRATLDEDVDSTAGVRQFVRVRFPAGPTGDGDGLPSVAPMPRGGAGVLSSVALGDGWLVVDEATTSLPAGTTVEVEDWEWQP